MPKNLKCNLCETCNNCELYNNCHTYKKYLINAAFILMAAFFCGIILSNQQYKEDALEIVFVSENRILQDKEEQPELGMYAGYASLYDARNNRLLYGKNENVEVPMASTTKIMTCILALENCDLNEVVTVSSYASKQPAVKAGLKEGEQYYLGDLLYVMMLESYNDVAVAVAEHIGGSTYGFAVMMNEKASELGMDHTYFITPNGLDAEDENGKHRSTALDMAKLGSYALNNEKFREIIQTRSITIHDIYGNNSIMASNKDAFLDKMSGAIGIKTGYTNGAGYCFVGAVEDENRTFVSVILACGWPPNKNYKWVDTTKLMSFGLENYGFTTYQSEKSEYQVVSLNNKSSEFNWWNTKNQTNTVWGSNVYGEEVDLLLSNYDELKIVELIPLQVNGNIAEGQNLGMRYVFLNNRLLQEEEIVAANSVIYDTFIDCFRQIIMKFLI